MSKLNISTVSEDTVSMMEFSYMNNTSEHHPYQNTTMIEYVDQANLTVVEQAKNYRVYAAAM